MPVAALVFLLAVESLLQWLRWHGREVPRAWSFGLLGVVFFYVIRVMISPPAPGHEVGGGFLFLLVLALLLAVRFVKRWVESDR